MTAAPVVWRSSEPSPDPHGIATAVVKGAESEGFLFLYSNNGRMMEGYGGASICDVRVRNRLRQLRFRSYVAPYPRAAESHAFSPRA